MTARIQEAVEDDDPMANAVEYTRSQEGNQLSELQE